MENQTMEIKMKEGSTLREVLTSLAAFGRILFLPAFLMGEMTCLVRSLRFEAAL